MLGVLIKSVLPKIIKVGFGKTEVVKTGKGLAVGGMGAAAVQIAASMGWLPEAVLEPAVLPYTVAIAAAIVNALRQFIRDNT